MARWDRDHKPPDDWTEEIDGYHMALICLPNSVEWRTVLLSALWEMTSARYYSWEDGRALEAKKIATEVLASVSFDCNNNLDRIATALESLDSKYTARLTWQEILDDLEATLGTGNFIYLVLKWFMDLFPSIALKADGTQLIMGLWRYLTFSKPLMELMTSGVRAMWALVVAVGGGGLLNTVLTGWQTLTLWFLDYLQGNKDIGDIVEDIPQSGIPDSEGGTGGDDPDNDPTKRAITNIFLEHEAMSVNNNQQVTVNCGCGGNHSGYGCSGGSGVGFIPDQSPSGTTFDDVPYQPPIGQPLPFPSDWDDWATWQLYKCKAANAMTLNFAESLYQIYDIAHRDHPENTRSILVQSIFNTFRALDFMFGADWLYGLPFYDALIQWESEAIADYIYQEPDLSPFDIFTDLRNDIITRREDYVCGIYGSGSSADVKNFLMGEMSTFITGSSYSAAVKAWATDIIDDMLSTYWCNIPFKFYENIEGYTDATAIDCQFVCGGYTYPTGVCTTSDGTCTNPEDGDGPEDFTPTDPIDTDGWWRCVFTTPVTIASGMTLGCRTELVEGSYTNWQLYAIVDGVDQLIWNYNSHAGVNWPTGSLDSFVGQELQGIYLWVGGWHVGQDPAFTVDGVRLGT